MSLLSEDLSRYKCTCENADMQWDHDYECDLWSCHGFDLGIAAWDPTNSRLRWLEEDELRDLMPQIEAEFERDGLVSLHDAVDDAIGGVIRDSGPIDLDEDDGKDEQELVEDLPVIETTDVSEYGFMTVADLVDDQLMKQCVTEAVDMWLLTQADGPPNFSYRGVTWVWEKAISTWKSEILGCHCGAVEVDKGLVECENCGVGRLTSTSRNWYQLHLRPNELNCMCATPGRWKCTKCGIERNVDWRPWDKMPDKGGGYKQQKFDGTTWSGHSTGGATTYNTTTYVPKCRHYMQEVTFPDGTMVWASSHFKRKENEALPDLGFYLDSVWTPECLAFFVPWQDYGLPKLAFSRVMEGIKLVHTMAQSGKIVEIGCIGGHGRTGTVLGCLAILTGVPVADAAKWVQDNYCEEAIEGARQEWFLEWFDAVLHDKEIPEMPSASTFGQRKKDRSANKKAEVSLYKDSLGQYYCGGCQTDTKEKEPEPPPAVCWWCEGTFKRKDPKPAVKSSTGKPTKPFVSASEDKGGKKSSNPKKWWPLAIQKATGNEATRLLRECAEEELWPAKRVLFSKVPGFHCSHCKDQVIWRWPTGEDKEAGWAHFTAPAIFLYECEEWRTKNQCDWYIHRLYREASEKHGVEILPPRSYVKETK